MPSRDQAHRQALPDLDRALADALLAWYDTTHGSDLAHDHHCPAGALRWDDPRPIECTCGWTAVLEAERARVLALEAVGR